MTWSHCQGESECQAGDGDSAEAVVRSKQEKCFHSYWGVRAYSLFSLSTGWKWLLFVAATLKTSLWGGSEAYLEPEDLFSFSTKSVISGTICVYYAERHPCQLPKPGTVA